MGVTFYNFGFKLWLLKFTLVSISRVIYFCIFLYHTSFFRQWCHNNCYETVVLFGLLFYTTRQHILAPSSEFVSSSIPSWQIFTAHAQPFRGARDLVFCLKVPLASLLLWASSEGSGETARMRRLAWTFAARIGYKYQIRMTRSILFTCFLNIRHSVNLFIFVVIE